MSVFAWGQIFPRSIALNRIYQNVQEIAFKTIQTLFHCGFLCQKKTPEPHGGHSEDRSKQRGKLGWATAASFHPLLFSKWFVMCDIVFLCGYISCTNMLVDWQGKESRLQSPVAPDFPVPVAGKPPCQPWRNALERKCSSLHSDCPSWAQLPTLHLWIMILFPQWNVE